MWSRFGIKFSETSTWQGIVLLLTVFGVSITPEQQYAVAVAGASVVGALGLFIKDKP